MHVISLRDLATRSIADFGSEGFGIVPMSPGAHVVVCTLSPGGRIGRHSAVVDQCLVVVEGDAEVSGEDGISHVIHPGSVALWDAGESHETRSQSGLTALIVEGDGLVVALA
jgi:quercetin dioxygenase-like cupin family protein